MPCGATIACARRKLNVLCSTPTEVSRWSLKVAVRSCESKFGVTDCGLKKSRFAFFTACGEIWIVRVARCLAENTVSNCVNEFQYSVLVTLFGKGSVRTLFLARL